MTTPRPLPRNGRASTRPVPAATVARLPLYLRALSDLADRGASTVSSDELSTLTGVGSAVVRKDFSFLGSSGTRGVGYEVVALASEISSALGLDREWPVAIIGVGKLGQALANYPGFTAKRFHVVAMFDNGSQVGSVVNGHVVRHIADLEQQVQELAVSIAVIATPAAVAQDICARLVSAGVRSILNFAPTLLTVPDHVEVRNVELSSELQILAWHAQLRETTAPHQPHQSMGESA